MEVHWWNRPVTWLIAISFFIVVCVAFVFMPTSESGWEHMKTCVTDLETEARSRNLPRSVLSGKPISGNAWDEYNIALRDVQTMTEDPNGGILATFNSQGKSADRATVDRLLAGHGGVIDHLRLGAQRSNGQYPYQWQRGAEMELPSLLAIRKAALLAVAQAKVWAENGRPQEAADLLLDVSVFARDLSANAPLLSHLIGLAVYSMTFDELHNLILSGKLKQKDLVDLEKKLEIVDRDFPGLGTSLANDVLASSLTTLDMSNAGTSVQEWMNLAKEGGWRYGFSSRRMAAEAFDERERYLERFQGSAQMEFATVKKVSDVITAEAEGSSNPMIRMAMPNLTKMVLSHREPLARLRLLRAGTAFLGRGELPKLADPFGDELLYSQEPGKLKVWSIGRDARSQNGEGGWNPKDVQPDIVLEISK